MFSIADSMRKDYVAAAAREGSNKPSFSQQLKAFILLLRIILLTLLELVRMTASALFCSSKSVSISNQLALVTGKLLLLLIKKIMSVLLRRWCKRYWKSFVHSTSARGMWPSNSRCWSAECKGNGKGDRKQV